MTRITMNEYQRMAQRTSPEDGHDRMDNGVLGLIGETGEIVDLYKKYRYQSKPGTAAPEERLCEELGDALWYIAELSRGIGKDLKDVAKEDFLEYDRRAGRDTKLTHKRDMRRNIVTLASLANAICESVEKEQFAHVEFLIRRMLNAAANLAYICGSTLRDVAIENIAKLQRRYPDGFDAGISMGRYE